MGRPWPLSLVTGFLGSGKTTLITQLLRHPDMADTVVIVNEFGEIGLDHHLVKQVTDQAVLLPNGCICCTVRQDVIQTLRDLHRAWLQAEVPDFGRVLVETTGLADPADLIASLAGHPALADIFALSAVVTVIDAEYGAQNLRDHSTCWHQVCLADHLVISKCDLAQEAAAAALEQQAREINPLASIRRFPANVSPDFVFDRTARRPAGRAFACIPGPDHLAEVSTNVLKPGGPLSWRKFQVWLHDLLEQGNPAVLRLKGCLRFDQSSTRMIVQAVHQTFYPIVEAPDNMDGTAEFLVLITAGPLPTDVARGFDRCKLDRRSPPAAAGGPGKNEVL